MYRVIDIETDGLFLAVHRGFLTVNAGPEERGRIAIEDIEALIVHAHGTTWSNTVFTRLSERAVPVVLCGPNHAPIACVWPLEGHYQQAARMRAQLAATKPLGKQIWARIVAAKIRMQGEVLAYFGTEAGAFATLARNVRSGDPDNLEAQAARRYWKALMGPGFNRDQAGGGTNGLLNYGYTVLRALVSRAICAAGLHPTISVFHSNRNNAFALSDDLMEPYRPFVDLIVQRMVRRGIADVTQEAKRELGRIGVIDLMSEAGVTPLALHAQRFVHSVALSFEAGTAALALPTRIASLDMQDSDDTA